MELARKYNPREVEDKWFAVWMKNKYFSSRPNPDKKPFTIVIPPPNVTGVLHMGHMLNNTIQDVLVRKARMQGYEACWVPGTDHASIATEAKVVAKLKEQGIDKNNLSRDEFMTHAWEWKEKHGGIILEQLKKLGASCDWDRTKFTMDEALSESVIKVFVDLYQKGKIYRGVRMVNWDPQAKTAVSDEEVVYKEEQSKLYFVNYKIAGEKGHVTIATTRPETILGDTAVCVNPNDTRFQHLIGKQVVVPLVNRVVPVIADEYVDMEFGTGCLKITPAHDINDYEIGIRHHLESIDIFNDNGTIHARGGMFVGEDRFKARKLAAKQLEADGLLEKVEDYRNKIGLSERTNAAIEPKLSMQWFLEMKEISKPALENVLNDNIRLVPPKFKNTYNHWLENPKDWCISRQLWWGQRIPAYYLPNSNEFVVAETAQEALELAKEKTGNNNLSLEDLRQDEDVLDTWFSSWLWPISVFDGIRYPDNDDINYYYPTSVLVTGHDIIFFWVARMIISGYEYRHEMPFKDVYFTGMVRDSQRRKMSKQLGNSPDPLDLIKEYGADGVRTGMLFSSPAGNDLLFDVKLCEQGRNFANKIWNAFRLVKGWTVANGVAPENGSDEVAIDWMEARINQALVELEDHFAKYRISDALMTIYKLIWSDFCSWYLEAIKPDFEQPIDSYTFEKTIALFEKLMQIAHPFMPFITEEIWHMLKDRDEKDCIMIANYPEPHAFDTDILARMDKAMEVITNIRNIRQQKQISPKEPLKVFARLENIEDYHPATKLVWKLANISDFDLVNEKVENTLSFHVGADEWFLALDQEIDHQKEIGIIEEEIKYLQGFLVSVNKKLGNERFVQSAPAQVVELERKKHDDAEKRISALQEKLTDLNAML
ncbi:MAG: valine--tRNA ligase [Cyclobacteriaceae bacterium]|nr:valine--tRNA ligase [Cyclobacteriaceae bacterium]